MVSNWNVRGLGDPIKCGDVLMELLSSNPSLILFQETKLAHILSGTSKTGYPIFIAKPPTKTNITTHGPSQPAQALLRSKPKSKDKRPSPPTLLCFVQPLSVSSNPCDII
jgi:hypothetical protein